MNRNERTMTTIILAFVLGSLIGAGAALLMAPESGRRTRAMIKDKGAVLKDRAAGTVEETKSRIDDLASQTKDRVSSLTHRGGEYAQEAKEQIEHDIKAAKKSLSY
jgi:gas vesicle protein